MLRIVLLAIAVCLAAPAWAQNDDSSDGDIVVTARRYVDAYENFTVPHVAQVRRADFAVRNLTIVSDTRDAAARRQELRQALQSLVRFADQNTRVSVALMQEDEDDSGASRIIAYTVEKAMNSLSSAGRPNSEKVTIAVRTRVAAGDNLDAVDARFDSFVRDIPRPGRVEASLGEMQLVLADPQQYRAGLLTDIAADATRIATTLGAGYGARLEGLENPIAWRRRAGDLDLRLFVPYRMVIMPRGSD